ncbi:MAG: NAD-dependent succinate-semialdehyde dehydrogenase [Anaerolineales bacterium]|nr:NAD-dependent succinate-semialdehyde dehydrogenase [Anaerolineales bacterium]
MTYIYKQYINGEWVEASNGGTWEVINPATEEVVQTVPYGTADDANAAIEAAARAFPEWANQTAYKRAAILKKASDIMRSRLDELARTTTLECGKPLSQSRGEWFTAADLFEWFAEECKRVYGRTIPSRVPRKRMTVIKQPIGVVGVITAWNFPAYNTARAWAAALAAGCTVVAKPAEDTPLTAMEMTNILVEAGIPTGVMNLINGEPAPIGQAMLDHPDCRKISFTGSTEVGRILMEGSARTFTRLGLELGGNAPVIVFPDADIARVAKGAVSTKYWNAGQACTGPQRFMVQESALQQFIDTVVPAVEALKVGNGLESDVAVGPIINERQRGRIESLVMEGVAHGATVLTGGSRPAGMDKGFFYQPTVVTNVALDQRLYHEEIFGPVMPITTFNDVDEAIYMANQTPYGLAAYVWTNDLNTAIKAYEGLEFGLVGVNEWYPQATEAPFVGWKASGLGAEAGAEGLEDYLETKLVSIGNIR